MSQAKVSVPVIKCVSSAELRDAERGIVRRGETAIIEDCLGGRETHWIVFVRGEGSGGFTDEVRARRRLAIAEGAVPS
jgi:hypothetical protein